MFGLVTLIAALSTTSAFANPSVFAECTGDGWSIDVGLNPGTEGTDQVELTADDGHGHVEAFEATITSGKFRHVLRQGVVLNNKAKVGDQATLKLKRTAGSWTYQGATHPLTCALN